MTNFYKVFYSRPLFYVAIVFILGILFSSFLSLSIIFFLSVVSVTGLICLISFFLKKNFIGYIALFLGVFFFASFIYQNSYQFPFNHISNLVSREKKQVYIKGKIINDPVYSKTFYGGARTTFMLSSKKIKPKKKWQKCVGRIRVNLYGHPDEFQYGDFLLLQGKLYEPYPPTNPGQFNYKKYLSRKSIYALLTVNKKNSIRLISKNQGNFLMVHTLRFKQKLKNKLYNFLPKNNAALISAMLLGDRKDLPEDIVEAFKKSGTMHILAISGLHVGIIIFILLGLFKILGVPPRWNYLLVMIFVIWYALLTGARPSVVRAALMAFILLFGKIIYREVDIYNSLGVAAIVLLLYNPHQLFMVSFMFSFIAVLSLVYLTPKIEAILNFKNIVSNFTLKRFASYLIRILSGSIAVWIGLMPLIWWHFNIISPVTVIANIIVIPLSFLTLLISLFSIVSSFILVPLAKFIFSFLNIIIVFFYHIVSTFSRFKYGHFYFPDLKFLYLALFYSGIGLLSIYKNFKISKRKLTIIMVVIITVIVGYKAIDTIKSDNQQVKITILDVQNGDSIFLQLPNNKNILIDAGRAFPYNSGEFIISPFLWKKGVRGIDCLILTHPDSDHIGGATWLMEYFKVKNVINSGIVSESNVYRTYINKMKDYNIKPLAVRSGFKLKGYSEVKIKVLNPSLEVINSKGYSTNDKSIVIELIYKKFSMLLCADVSGEIIKKLYRIRNKGEIDIVKIPHHGRISAKSAFIIATLLEPEAGVISGTADSKKVLKNINLFKQNGVLVYTTGRRGAISIVTDGESFRVKGFLDK